MPGLARSRGGEAGAARPQQQLRDVGLTATPEPADWSTMVINHNTIVYQYRGCTQ